MTEGKTITNVDFKVSSKDEDYFNCIFQHCDFNGITFPKMLFEQCRFISCNLSLCKMSMTAWNNIVFDGCKMTGIDFSNSNKFTFSIVVDKCNLQYASFQGLNLQGVQFRDSQLIETDFSGCNMKKAVFSGSNLSRAVFSHCNLEEADFTTAIGYTIDPNLNRLSKARFSLQGVPGLLTTFGIVIDQDNP